jgi:MinD-like ATPase involved in chromosome partitioning or flagellar assembly
MKEHRLTKDADICLLHPDFAVDDGLAGCPVRLCESKAEEEAQSAGAPAIYKYQPLHVLLGRLLELYKLNIASQKSDSTADSVTVCSIFSAAGGVGKTTIAIHLARTYAEQGERCLYWNMELAPGAYFSKEADAEQAARFIYGLRHNSAWMTDCLPGMIAKSEAYGFDYFAGFGQVRESLELSGADMSRLIAFLKQTGKYDMILFDLEATLHDRILAVLMESDAIGWITTEDRETSAKSVKLLSELERRPLSPTRLKAIRFILNKHSGAGGNESAHAGEDTQTIVPIAVRLPYVAGWKQGHGANKPLSEPMYKDGIAKLAKHLRIHTGGGAVAARFDNPVAARAYS